MAGTKSITIFNSYHVIQNSEHRPRKWGASIGLPPLQYLWGAIHVIGSSWKMLNQPPISPLTLAMTENY